MKGQRIRLSGINGPTAADGDYVITDLDILTLTVTSAPPLPGTTSGSGAGRHYYTRRDHQPAPRARRVRGQHRLQPGRDRLRAVHRRPDLQRDDEGDANRRQLQRRRPDGRYADQVQRTAATIYTIKAVGEKTLTLDLATPLRRPPAQHHDQQGHRHARSARQQQLARRRLPRGPADQDRRHPGCNDGNGDGVCMFKIELISRNRQEPDEQDLADEHPPRRSRLRRTSRTSSWARARTCT